MKKFLLLLLTVLSAGLAQAAGQNIDIKTWDDLMVSLTSANSGATLTLQQNIVMTAETPYMYTKKISGGTYTLDLNGHYIQRKQLDNLAGIYFFSLESGTTLNVIDSKGSGYIDTYLSAYQTGAIATIFYVEEGATLALDGVTLTGSKGYSEGIRVKGGIATIKDSQISGVKVLNGNSFFFSNHSKIGTKDNHSNPSFSADQKSKTYLYNTAIYYGSPNEVARYVNGTIYCDGKSVTKEQLSSMIPTDPDFTNHLISCTSSDSEIPQVTIGCDIYNNVGGTVTGTGKKPLGSFYTLTANPQKGWEISEWDYTTEENAVTRKAVATNDRTHLAVFKELPYYTIDVRYNSAECSVTGDGKCYPGEDATINVTPKTGYRFVRFEIGSTGQVYSTPYTFKNVQETKLVRVICRAAWKFSVSSNNSSMGTVQITNSGVVANGYVDAGSSVNLLATPAAGYEFSHWSDGNYNATRTIKNVNQDTNLTAIFVEKGATVSYQVYVGGRQVNNKNASDILADGGSMKFNPTTNTLTLNNVHLTASKAQTLKIGHIDGDFTINLIGDNYIENTQTACLVMGITTVDKMNIDINGPGTLKMYTPYEIAWYIESDSWVNIYGAKINILNGRIDGNKARGLYCGSGTTMYVGNYQGSTKSAITGLNNLSFSGCGIVGNYKYDTSDKRIEGSTGNVILGDIAIGTGSNIEPYRPHALTLKANAEGLGQLFGSGSYFKDEQVEISAVPEGGVRFVNWSDGNTEPKRTITMSTTNKTLTATFERWATDGGYVTVKSSNDNMGKVIYNGQEWEEMGSTITISATPQTGYIFTGWSDGNNQASRTITMGNENINLTANFAHPQYGKNHPAVDLGLPSGTLWAEYNIGANTPEETGDFYAWGEIYMKDKYDIFTYLLFDKGGYPTKYNGKDNLTTLMKSDDAANFAWGEEWRTPIRAELDELTTFCTLTYDATTKCTVATSQINGKQVRFYRSELMDQIYPESNKGLYWIASASGGLGNYNFKIDPTKGMIVGGDTPRYLGLPIRAVQHGDMQALEDGLINVSGNNSKGTKVTKYLENGQVRIKHGDHIYNVMGIEVK